MNKNREVHQILMGLIIVGIVAFMVLWVLPYVILNPKVSRSKDINREIITNTVSDAISTGIKIKPEDICMTNTGVVIDLDGDSINDHVIMNGNIVSFSKGIRNNELGPKRILMLIGMDNIRGHSFTHKEGYKLPMFRDLNMYYMPNLGTNNESDGLPRFGAVEAQ